MMSPRVGAPRSDVAYVYCLIDPINHEVRYIGESRSPYQRLRQHISQRTASPGIRTWVEELREFGLEPEMVVLEAVPATEINAAERKWIEWGWQARFRLLNRTGSGAYSPTQRI